MNTETINRKPLPEILPETGEFRAAAKRHELVIQTCRACGAKIYFPRLLCPHCMAEDFYWIKAKGLGVVYSYTIVHKALHEGFEDEVPYVYGIVELEEGVRMIANIVNVALEDIFIGMAVEVIFEDRTREISVPQFQPIRAHRNP
ncbi:MAG: Zn-ribbon domain-containing OB-fold protein [Kiritimatiellales bacterium]